MVTIVFCCFLKCFGYKQDMPKGIRLAADTDAQMISSREKKEKVYRHGIIFYFYPCVFQKRQSDLPVYIKWHPKIVFPLEPDLLFFFTSLRRLPTFSFSPSLLS